MVLNMKKVLLILFVLDLLGFVIGFSIVSNKPNLGNQLIGFSLLVLMFFIVPVFLYMRYSKKRASDFVLKNSEKKEKE